MAQTGMRAYGDVQRKQRKFFFEHANTGKVSKKRRTAVKNSNHAWKEKGLL